MQRWRLLLSALSMAENGKQLAQVQQSGESQAPNGRKHRQPAGFTLKPGQRPAKSSKAVVNTRKH
jgi:hypothetical protein